MTDPEISEGLCEVLKAAGLATAAFPSAERFLQGYRREAPGCVILDMQLHGMSGLELQRKLAADRPSIPVIMLSGHASVRLAVQVVKAGAYSFLEKPHCPRALQQEVRQAVEFDAQQRRRAMAKAVTVQRLDTLTDREREVLDLLAKFCTPKQISSRLGISLRTVDFHRANLLKKMRMDDVPELVHFYLSLNAAT